MQAHRRVVAGPLPANDVAPALMRPRPVAEARWLDDRERHAVAVGRADAFRYGWNAAASAGLGRRLLSSLAVLAGVRRVTPFADERLELLRLFACMMRRGERGLDALAARLLAAGYSQAALHQATMLALA